MGKSGGNYRAQTRSEYEPIGEECRPLLAQVNHIQPLLRYRNNNNNKKKNHIKKNKIDVFFCPS